MLRIPPIPPRSGSAVGFAFVGKFSSRWETIGVGVYFWKFYWKMEHFVGKGTNYLGRDVGQTVWSIMTLELISQGHWAQDVKCILSYERVVPCSPTPPAHREDKNQGRTRPATSPTHPTRWMDRRKSWRNFPMLPPLGKEKTRKDRHLSCIVCVCGFVVCSDAPRILLWGRIIFDCPCCQDYRI
jgi:hypothetical protein